MLYSTKQQEATRVHMQAWLLLLKSTQKNLEFSTRVGTIAHQ